MTFLQVREKDGLIAVLVAFGRSLRGRGIRVGTGQLESYAHAVSSLDATDLTDLYWAGRACLVNRHEDVAAYEIGFLSFFFGIEPTQSRSQGEPDLETGPGDPEATSLTTEISSLQESEQGSQHELPGDEGVDVGAEASVTEALRQMSFSEWSEGELALLPQVMAGLEPRLPLKEIRRTRANPLGRRMDIRRTVRRSLRHEGELLERKWRARRKEPRRVVILMDVSGSMSAHSRALLHFAYALVQSRLRVEAFCFGTRLSRITSLLRDRDADRAVHLAAAATADWAGGTRIGESLAMFLRDWASRGVVRGSLVLIVSDGLERGDPELLSSQVERLRRLAYQIVWLNPLKGDPDYQPLARGMKAALPHIDHLVAADSVDDLSRISDLIPRLV